MAALKRTWVISFSGSLHTPWIARPDTGAKVFFGTADSLVRFLIDGGLDAAAIRITLPTAESGGEATVRLADRASG
jgi:hypothetical protein